MLRWTTKTFIKELNRRYPSKFIVLGKYNSIHTKIRVRCCKCQYEYDVEPNSILNRGTNCPNCSNIAVHKKQRWTTIDFKKKVKELAGESYVVIGSYVDSQTKIDMKHLTCGHVFSIKPNAFIQGHRCLYCFMNKKKTTKQFKQEINDLVGNDYDLIGEYNGCMNYVKLKHNKCGHIFGITPNNFLGGSRCPYCTKLGCSNGEQLIKYYLDDKGINYKYGYLIPDLVDMRNLHFDFWLDDLNIAIEYDGIQHFKPIEYFGGVDAFHSQQIRDRLKDNYCKNNNIKLIRIPYTMDTKNKVKDILSKNIQDKMNPEANAEQQHQNDYKPGHEQSLDKKPDAKEDPNKQDPKNPEDTNVGNTD